MKLRNILIVVKDIERARKYYHDLLDWIYYYYVTPIEVSRK